MRGRKFPLEAKPRTIVCVLAGHDWSEWIRQSLMGGHGKRNEVKIYRWCHRCHVEEWR